MQPSRTSRVATKSFVMSVALLLAVCNAASSGTPETGGTPATASSRLSAILEESLEKCANGLEAPLGNPIKHSMNDDSMPRFAIPPNPDDYYSYAAREQNGVASIVMQVLVDRFSNPRFAHILRQLTSAAGRDFDEGTIRLAREARFKAAKPGGKAIAAWYIFKVSYRLNGMTPLTEMYPGDALKNLENRARAGDVEAEADLTYLYETVASEITITGTEYLHFLADAAVADYKEADVTITQRLGRSTCSSPPEVQEFLHKIAWKGLSQAELIQATRMLETNDPSLYHDIGVLLHGAANSSDAFVQTWATGILATSPVAEIRDPAYALEMARSLADMSDPDELEVLAAAFAANGQFDEAVNNQRQAVAKAKTLRWNTTPMESRLSAYNAKQAWIGYLCDCTQLVPGENP